MEQVFLIAGQRVTRKQMEETDVQWVQRLLRDDHTSTVRPQCLCKSPGVEMGIRKLPSRYILARMPDSGEKHHLTCDAFCVAPDHSGLSGYQESAIVTDDEGITRIHLNVPLAQRPERLTTKPPEKILQTLLPARKRSRTTLLGVVHHIWEKTGLNKWFASMQGKRNWHIVRKCVLQYADAAMVGREALRDFLFVPEMLNANQRAEQLDRCREFLYRACAVRDGAQHYALLFAEVTGMSPTQYGGRLVIKQLKDCGFWVQQQVVDDFAQRFPRAMSILNEPTTARRVVGLFVLYPGKKERQYHIRDGALMPVNEQWIPFDSSYEAAIADALVESKRSFVKPLRYDADEAAVFPDFLLFDASHYPLPMEIYGFSGNLEYEQRKREKIAYYQNTRKPYWHWDIATTGSVAGSWPPFPPVRSR